MVSQRSRGTSLDMDRRAFLQRAAAAGIALPSLSAILAACGERGRSRASQRRRQRPAGGASAVRNRRHRGCAVSAGSAGRAGDLERSIRTT